MRYAFSGGKDTVEEHRVHGGNADIDMAYQWLTYFEPDDKKLLEIKKRYESGELLSGELKQILVDTLVPIIHEHQKRREHARKDLPHVILKDRKNF
jgi:tryptophanyl-tRNA synthetase